MPAETGRYSFDQDALDASLDLVGRSGAGEVEFGYQHDDVPVEEADWYAQAMFRGARIIVEHRTGPVEALEGLARRLLASAKCRRCGKSIRLSDALPGCRWRREGARWVPGCGLPIDFSIPAPR